MIPRFILISSLFFIGAAVPVLAQSDASLTVASPNGAVVLTVHVDNKLEPYPSGDRLYYNVAYRGEPVLLDSPFGLDFKGAPGFAGGIRIASYEHTSNDETWERYWGKRTNVRNRYNEVTVHLQENEAPNREVSVTFRTYDEGVAFRYHLPAAWGDFKLASERTGFRFVGEPTVWAANFGGYHSSQERPYHQMPMSQLSPTEVYGMPVLVRVSPSRWAAVTEANLTDWAGMYLTHEGNLRSTLISSLSPRLDEPDVVVRSTAPRLSPWRVVMLGESAASLIESDLIHNLNEPAVGDFSWVMPGLSSWDWWNGPYLPDADYEVGKNTETMKAYVDLSAEMGWEYVLVDAGWYNSGPVAISDAVHGPESDITDVVDGLDMPELISYADSKNVKVLLWLHWVPVRHQMDEAFPLYEEWGAAGVKIDFMDRDDQEMVNYYHRVVKKAAAHHLAVDFHGAYKPTGWSRTYPNLITREGVMGNEYNKWSADVTPEHKVTIPFTRGLLGEVDYTPGGFRNRTADTFRPVNTGPWVIGTRVNELAMFVVYESALQVVSDSPYAYRVSPAGTDFLKIVPATWDDTRALAGQPGDFVAVARRSGEDWFLGAMTDEQQRTLALPLDFLGAGQYRATIWADAHEAADFPDRLLKQERIVTARDTLEASMAPAGGYVVHLAPVR